MTDPDAIEMAIRSARAIAAWSVEGSAIAAADPHVLRAVTAAHAGDHATLVDELYLAAEHLGAPIRMILAALEIKRRMVP